MSVGVFHSEFLGKSTKWISIAINREWFANSQSKWQMRGDRRTCWYACLSIWLGNLRNHFLVFCPLLVLSSHQNLVVVVCLVDIEESHFILYRRPALRYSEQVLWPGFWRESVSSSTNLFSHSLYSILTFARVERIRESVAFVQFSNLLCRA